MIFNQIKFFQYRCFNKGVIDFCSSLTGSEPINLILASNGSGKTELLFAFWWVLYGFDFRSLLNKEDTPYSINSEKYRELQNGSIGGRDYCSVELNFEHNNTKYFLLKKEYFEKVLSRRELKTSTEIEFSTIDKNGVSSIPNRNIDEVEKILEKIIPKRVLNGIIFDGERMQRISSADEKAVESIQGVINDVTNKDFIELCLSNIIEVTKDYNSELRRVANVGGNLRLGSITNELDELNSDIVKLKDLKEFCEEKEKKLEKQLTIITDALKNDVKTRENINILGEKTNQRKMLLKDAEDKIEDLFGELNKYGYTLAIDSLVKEAEELIKSYDIPNGLTVDAIEDILKYEKCICGTKFNSDMIEVLHALQKLLPPDNLNSVLHEEILGLVNRKKDTKENLQKVWNSIREKEKLTRQLTEDISELSSQIGAISENSDILEKERSNIEKELGSISTTLRGIPKKIEYNVRKYDDLLREKNKIIKSMNIAGTLMKKCDFIEKCRKALIEFKDKYRQNALYEINELLEESYSELAEDYENGRGVYITQLTGKQFRIVNYYRKHVEEFISKANWNIISNNYKIMYSDLNDDLKKEIAIIENAVSKSTGQSKSVTIAFVKAILDYSCMDKDDEEFQTKKDYPLVIDSPFGDLSGENLIKPAQRLNTFSKQVILMVSPQIYEMVAKYIEPNVGSKHVVEKQINQNDSMIYRGN